MRAEVLRTTCAVWGCNTEVGRNQAQLRLLPENQSGLVVDDDSSDNPSESDADPMHAAMPIGHAEGRNLESIGFQSGVIRTKQTYY